jgi:ABC-2 type transport system permease protein
MRNTWIIASRELKSYFVSAIAYAVGSLFLLIVGVYFYLLTRASQEPSMGLSLEDVLRYFFSFVTTMLLFIGPILTMRLLAEEQHSGTLELLMTAPVRDWQVVLGKFLAALLLLLFILVPTLYYLFLLARFGNPDVVSTLAGYLGLLLIGSALLAVGTFTSTVTRNQIVAALLGLVLVLAMWLFNLAGSFLSGPLGSALEYLSPLSHFDDFARGVVDTTHVVYYLSVVAIFLFLATRVLESRRWSQ